jgi:hypothetical protein
MINVASKEHNEKFQGFKINKIVRFQKYNVFRIYKYYIFQYSKNTLISNRVAGNIINFGAPKI